ncbi:MAG: response regulator [Chloroflexi bacterium]|nr:response regulator [Chloroflexota bacterium]
MSGKRILVVDDDSLLAKTIDVCLTRRGHDVRVFHSGANAVKYLFEEQPDLMLVDIRLPDCDGWFLAEMLKKLEMSQKVRMIVMSVLDPDRAKVADTKPYAYIQKPFDMGQLMQAVEESLDADRCLIGA